MCLSLKGMFVNNFAKHVAKFTPHFINITELIYLVSIDILEITIKEIYPKIEWRDRVNTVVAKLPKHY
jgi:hypothetical protein